MIPYRFTSPEPLEHRIAPAGLVTVTFMDGVLTVNGADGQDHAIEIIKTGKNTFSVEGTGTDVDELGQTSKDFRGALKHVHIEGGGGADSFALTKLNPLKSLEFDGGSGVDSLTTTNFRGAKGGHVEINLGTGTGTIEFSGPKTLIAGELTIAMGDGGAANLVSATTKIGGDVTVNGGSGSDLLSITGETTILKNKLTFTGGDGNDTFSATGETLKVKGFVAMDGGGGTNHFLFGADNNKFGMGTAPGLVDLKVGVGPGTVNFLGKSTVLLGDLSIDLGAGGGLAHLGSEVTTVRNAVQVAGGAGNDTLELDGRTSIGQTLSFLGNSGDDVLTATGNLLAVKGAMAMEGGSGASVFDLNLTKVALGGLDFAGGTSNDTVRILADGTIAGDVSLALSSDGTGPSSTILQSAAGVANGLIFAGNLTIGMTGATVDTLAIANVQVGKDFTAQTGENVSTVDISQLNILGNFKLQTGSGADVVNINNVAAQDFYIDTESGADELRIERNSLFNGPSQVMGIATILTGIGADQIRIGDASSAGSLKVMFKGSMTLDAGDGANMRNDIVGSNSFKSAPTIVATGGTLTQTEAV